MILVKLYGLITLLTAICLASLAPAANAFDILTANADRSVSVLRDSFESNSQQEDFVLDFGRSFEDIAIDPYGAFTYVSVPAANQVWVLDNSTPDLEVKARIDVGASPGAIAVTPPNYWTDACKYYIYVANRGNASVSVIDPYNFRVTATIGVGRQPEAIALDPSGRRAYVANYIDNTISVIDSEPVGDTHIPVDTIDLSAQPEPQLNPIDLAVSQMNGREHLFVANQGSSNVSMIDTASGDIWNPIAIYAPEGRPINLEKITASGDGLNVYVSNGADGTVQRINPRNSRMEGDPIPIAAVNDLAIGVDGLVYAAAGSGEQGSVSIIYTDRLSQAFNTVVQTIVTRAPARALAVRRNSQAGAMVEQPPPCTRNVGGNGGDDGGYINDGGGHNKIIQRREEPEQGDKAPNPQPEPKPEPKPEPPPPPPIRATCTRPIYKSRLTAPANIRLKDLVSKRKGIRLRAWASQTSVGKAQLKLPRLTAAKLKLAPLRSAKRERTIAARKLKPTTKERAYKLKLGRKMRRKVARALKENKRYKNVKLKLVYTVNAKADADLGFTKKATIKASLRGKLKKKGKRTIQRKVLGRSLCKSKFKIKVKGPKRIKLSKLLKKNGSRGKGVKVKAFCSERCKGQIGIEVWAGSRKKPVFWRRSGAPLYKGVSQKRISLSGGKPKTVSIKGVSSAKTRKRLRQLARRRQFKYVKVRYFFKVQTTDKPKLKRRAYGKSRLRLRFK